MFPFKATTFQKFSPLPQSIPDTLVDTLECIIRCILQTGTYQLAYFPILEET